MTNLEVLAYLRTADATPRYSFTRGKNGLAYRYLCPLETASFLNRKEYKHLVNYVESPHFLPL